MGFAVWEKHGWSFFLGSRSPAPMRLGVGPLAFFTLFSSAVAVSAPLAQGFPSRHIPGLRTQRAGPC